MLLPIEDVKEWALKYNLPISKATCQKCKKTFNRNIPFAVKGWRGLMTQEHECGKMFISSIAVPVGESLEKMRVLIG